MRAVRIALLGLVASGCRDEIGSCIPGTPGCVCDGSNSCEAGVVCIANRCEPLEETPPVADGGSSSGLDGGASDDSSGSTGPLERSHVSTT